jgi:flagellar assembly factor FliW
VKTPRLHELNRATAHSCEPAPAQPLDHDVDKEVVIFPQGLPGFEGCRSFVVCAAESAPFQWLTSVEGPPAAFLTVDPRLILPSYRFVLSRHDLGRLGAHEESALLWLSVVLLEPDGAVAVNLRAPIVINPATMIGCQMMPQDCVYPLRHLLVPAPATSPLEA